MQRSRHWLGWVILNWAMAVCCHALPPYWTDPFLTLGTPALVSNQVQFTLTGEPDVSYVIECSPDRQNWLPVTTNTSPETARLVSFDAETNDVRFYRAWRDPLPMFPGAIVARSNITMLGNNISIDSYDSGDPNYSDPVGRYDPFKRRAGGDVFSAEGFVTVGNADIKGKLYSSTVNAGQFSVGSNSSLGDLNWAGPGVQPGWYLTNFQYALPDVAAPYPTGLPPIGIGTNLWVLGNTNYIYAGNFTATSDKTISVQGKATVYISGSFNFPGTINIVPGGWLRLYVGEGSTHLGPINHDGTAFEFQYFGLPANTNVSWSGNEVFAGTIYAPQATLKLAAGGSAIIDFQGGCVAQNVQFVGSVNFHFDENLKRIGPMR